MVTAKRIDFEAGVVIIESLKKRRKNVYRAVPLPASLLDRLGELITLSDTGPEDRLWPWSRMTGYRRITEVMNEARIAGTWATPKGLRHGFGVRAVQSGAPLHLVQRWLGHADMKTTAIYASAVGPEEREIAARSWLDDEDAKGDVRFTTPHPPKPASSGPIRQLSDLEHIEGKATDTEKITKKPILKRIASTTQSVLSCQVLRFYLFCRRFSH